MKQRQGNHQPQYLILPGGHQASFLADIMTRHLGGSVFFYRFLGIGAVSTRQRNIQQDTIITCKGLPC